MHITILTMGSRGDVQPFIALALGLQKAGYRVRVASHANFEQEIIERGIEFALISGNPKEWIESPEGQALLQAKNPINFAKRMAAIFRPRMESVLLDSWNACAGTDAIIGGGLPFWGDIAIKLGVPFFFASLQPVNTTTAFPSLFTPPHLERLGGLYNRLTHKLFNQLLWQLFRDPVNSFRHSTLQESPLRFWHSPVQRMEQLDIHFLNAVSPAVIQQPHDWSNRAHMTGYWLLEPSADFTPPADLVEFLNAGTPPVYIGFGSMGGLKCAKVTEIALAALAKTQQRGILLAGWGGSQSDISATVFQIKSIPHSWLFPQMACIVHHGGAGTTAATLNSSIPGIAIPFMIEQQNWAYRTAKLGVSPPMLDTKKLTVDRLAQAINRAINDQSMRQRAAILGRKIRAENGIANAVKIIDQTVASKR